MPEAFDAVMFRKSTPIDEREGFGIEAGFATSRVAALACAEPCINEAGAGAVVVVDFRPPGTSLSRSEAHAHRVELHPG